MNSDPNQAAREWWQRQENKDEPEEQGLQEGQDSQATRQYPVNRNYQDPQATQRQPDGQDYQDLLDKAVARGAEILWKDHYWKEFNGYNHAFRDPWGNEIVLWGKAGENPAIPANFTRE